MSEPVRRPAPAVPRWTDSHCHVQEDYLPAGEEVAALLGRAAAAGVERAVCIGTAVGSSRQAVRLAAASAEGGLRGVQLWATVGLHPHEAEEGTAALVALAEEVAGAGDAPAGAFRAPGSVVGIGECGLDYYYDHSPRPAQREAFAAQAELARRLDLALVVHTRDAWDDTLAILREAPGGRTVIHCFTGGPAEAERCLELGCFLSFSGIVTFKSAAPVREAARACPEERLLVETDSPFLAPVPHRGHPNEPAYVAVVGAAVAVLRGAEPELLAATTSTNAAALFGLPAPR